MTCIFIMAIIRKGKKEDIFQVFELVRELAKYEQELDQVVNTPQKMEKDAFGDMPVFEFIVAEDYGKIVGTSIYYFRYSTWKGKRLYLEDIVVTEKSRGKGIGKMLFDQTIENGKNAGCTGMMWQVLDWNTPAIEFYKKYNTDFDKGWINCHLDF